MLTRLPLVLLLCLATLASATSAFAQAAASKTKAAKPAPAAAKVELSEAQQQALAALKKLEAKITLGADGSVTGIDLGKIETLDEQVPPITAFPQLEKLVLWGPGISDAALDHVAQLTNLRDLVIENCSTVTDAGIEKLKTLTKLKSINELAA